MRVGLALSIVISIILVSGAVWYRGHLSKPTTQSGLMAVEQNTGLTDEEQLKSFLDFSATSTSLSLSAPSAQEASTTSTDLVARSFISDYIAMAANGQADDASLQNLTSKYIESIPSLIQAKTVNYSDIKVVDGSRDNLTRYKLQFTAYLDELKSSFSDIDNSGKDNYTSMKAFSGAYGRFANELEGMNVPAPLVSDHVLLINTELSSAAGAEAASHGTDDATTAFAGIIVIRQNGDKEQPILSDMSQILSSNGI